MSKVFLDTSYAVALSAPSDENHERAAELAEQLEASNTYFVTTRAILLEIGNALSKLRHRTAAVRLLTLWKMIPKLKSCPHPTSYIVELTTFTGIDLTKSGD